MANEETIETITKSYEEKINNREKEVIAEKEQMRKDFEKEKADAIQKLKEEKNKEIADIVLGRKSVEEIQNKDKKTENENVSFFDKLVEKTKEKLGIKKGE